MESKSLQELKQLLIDFEKENWVAPRDKKSVTRHITQHIAKLLGKLGTITEKWEHGFEVDTDPIKKEVIPDLLYYAINLSNTYGVDLEKSFIERLKKNKEKVDAWREQGLIK